MRRPLYGWLAADIVSITGTRVSMLALPFFVLLTTGSPERTGLVGLVETLPLVATKVLGGPVIDRWGPRRVAIRCDLASCLVVGSVPVLYAGGVLSFPALLAIVAVAGSLRGPGDAAKAAMVPALVRATGAPTERVTGLQGTVERTASMLGFGLAGGLVASIGAADALVVDAASFAVSALVLALTTRGLPSVAPEAADDAPFTTQLREGWDFLRRDRVLVAIAVMISLTNMLDQAWFGVLTPVWGVERAGGAATVGLLFATFSALSALGAVVAAVWATRLPRYATYLVCFLLVGLPRFAVMALPSPLWAVLVVVGVGGLGAGFLNPILGAVIYERIPERLTGRVTSLTTSACYALMPVGGLLGGLLVGRAGLTAAMLVCGAAYFAVTMLPAVDPRWREIDRRPQPVEADSGPGSADAEREVVGAGVAGVEPHLSAGPGVRPGSADDRERGVLGVVEGSRHHQ